MLTNKGKHGLKALIYLANLPAGDLALVQDIAEANAIPKKLLDTILGELRIFTDLADRIFSDGKRQAPYSDFRPC